MSEQNPATPSTETETPEVEVVVEPNFVVKLGTRFPRASKVVAIIGGTLAVGGTALAINTARNNSHHLDSAKENVLEAGSEFAQAVSPHPETTDA